MTGREEARAGGGGEGPARARDGRRRAALIVNTRSRSGERTFFEALDRLGELGVALGATYAVRDPVRLPETVREVLSEGSDYELLVLGGGDGSVSSVVDYLAHHDTVLGLLPLGTANDFARTIGVPPDPVEAAEVALNGRQHRIDVGLVNDRPYLNVASVGIASKVVKQQSKALKRTWRVFAYAIALMQVARSLNPFFARLELDGKPAWWGFVHQVSIGNGRFHGGGLTVAEHAAIDDGRLDVYLVYPGRFWQLLASLLHLKFGLRKPDVLQHLSATEVHLSTDRPRSVDADGELATETPATFRVSREALTVIIPRMLPREALGLSQALERPVGSDS